MDIGDTENRMCTATYGVDHFAPCFREIDPTLFEELHRQIQPTT